MMMAIELLEEVMTKNDDLTESITWNRYPVKAEKQQIYQSRQDYYAMQGLYATNRYRIFHLGELKDKVFSYFADNDGNIYRITMFSQELDTDTWIIEGAKSDEANDL